MDVQWQWKFAWLPKQLTTIFAKTVSYFILPWQYDDAGIRTRRVDVLRSDGNTDHSNDVERRIDVGTTPTLSNTTTTLNDVSTFKERRQHSATQQRRLQARHQHFTLDNDVCDRHGELTFKDDVNSTTPVFRERLLGCQTFIYTTKSTFWL